MSANPLLFAMFFHVCWVFFLYTLLTVVRAPPIWGVDTKSGLIRKWAKLEPKISANLSNQFEWPLFFYTACILTMLAGESSDQLQAILAWLFIVGRVMHSWVHLLTNNIRLRGAIFTVNFLAAFCMWVNLIIKAIAQ